MPGFLDWTHVVSDAPLEAGLLFVFLKKSSKGNGKLKVPSSGSQYKAITILGLSAEISYVLKLLLSYAETSP